MAVSFRENYDNPGSRARFHYMPVTGIILVTGLGLIMPRMKNVVENIQFKKIGYVLLLLFLTFNGRYVFHKNYIEASKPGPRELRMYEDLLGEASIEFSKVYNMNTVSIPNVETTLPAFFHSSIPLIFVARYSVPYDESYQLL
jgi:hypothetical protein